MLLLQLHPISIFPIVKEKYFKNKSSLRKIAFIHLLRIFIQEHQYLPLFYCGICAGKKLQQNFTT